jgi:hypothetical protein
MGPHKGQWPQYQLQRWMTAAKSARLKYPDAHQAHLGVLMSILRYLGAIATAH